MWGDNADSRESDDVVQRTEKQATKQTLMTLTPKIIRSLQLSQSLLLTLDVTQHKEIIALELA